ncbi:MAG: hypothetical protein EPN97_01605 [Alphaproteobacteria bacterium]|nr:MAG: hypothetical protein EPN97_01605 [Alphaproteobacteria bacterium]
MFPGSLVKRIILLLLAANLLMGLGRIAVLPPFDDFDETAHYSRIEAAAFALPDANAAFLSADVVEYSRHGPMTPWWIRTQAILPAYNQAIEAGKPMQLDLGKQIKKQGYKDFRAFFSGPDAAKDYRQRYRERPGPAGYSASPEGNWEYQHPALYYLIMGRVLRLAEDAPLIQRLLVLRSASFLMAFAGFAIGLFATLRHLEIRGHPDARAVAALGAFYPFVMPAFFPEFARLGNDSLCLLLFSAVWTLMLWHLRRPREAALWALLGVAMGYAWLAKAFMIPVTCGLLLFMSLQQPPPEAGKTRAWAKRLWRRLLPALTAGAAACAIGIWPYMPGQGSRTLGSIEINDVLHGAGILAGDGVPWIKIFSNPWFMLASAAYNIADVKAAYAPVALITAALLMLALVFGAWLLRLPRDPRREEWLPLYPLFPLGGGLLLHCVLMAIAYRTAGTTPGHYFHVEAPALALMFGIGLLYWARRREGRIFGGILLAAAAVAVAVTTALRLALFTGCAWLSDNFINLNIDRQGEACRPSVIYERLALLSSPALGLPLLAGAMALFLAAAGMALPCFTGMRKPGK